MTRGEFKPPLHFWHEKRMSWACKTRGKEHLENKIINVIFHHMWNGCKWNAILYIRFVWIKSIYWLLVDNPVLLKNLAQFK